MVHDAIASTSREDIDGVGGRHPRSHSFAELTEIVGSDPALLRQLELLAPYAASGHPVHIYGETGTGKELIARALHAYSSRPKEKFITQNCGAMTDSLVQSLLFGHRRGAFTGADRDQAGLFEAAAGGTLLLDEVSDMSPAVQAALLRVLEDGDVTRVGETSRRRVDVRVLSAANRRLETEVGTGRLREDLYYRLVTLVIELPPLRERRSDIEQLARFFLERHIRRTGKEVRGLTSDALSALSRYDWPGNVRQLRNEVERACVLTCPGEWIDVEGLSSPVRSGVPRTVETIAHSTVASAAPGGRGCDVAESDDYSLPAILEKIECDLLRDAMERAKGNKTAAARMLGVSRQRLSQRLQRWRL